MAAFKKIGPAIASIGSAVSPAGGAGVQLGDVRLFPPGVDPGAGWLREGGAVLPYTPKLDEVLSRSRVLSFTGPEAVTSAQVLRLKKVNNLWFGVGSNGYLVSGPSPYSMSRVPNPLEGTGEEITDIVHNGSRYVVGRTNGRTDQANPRPYWTTDLVTWTVAATTFGTGAAPRSLQVIGTRFVAFCGEGRILSSLNGENWTQHINAGSGNAFFSSLFDGTSVVGFMSGNRVFRSIDGQSYEGITSNHGATIPQTCEFAKGRYWLSYARSVFSSTDLAQWAQTNVFTDHQGSAVIFQVGSCLYSYGGTEAVVLDLDYEVEGWKPALAVPDGSRVFAGVEGDSGRALITTGLKSIYAGLPGLRAPPALRKPAARSAWNAYTRIAA